ncbi:Protein ADP-ribosyltransferase PARP3 [Camellia lanceoleosa]|uniref:Protein ADP-ribosyltransferase PARP3 n=1 Tax=Camellia lanceoleosa TaxID=1840588 RepID=A0ACC0F2Y1_9ERIC|nr:Protein ADP-ribosyltransferase PARP3 [Camellia lanceoleosa]
MLLQEKQLRVGLGSYVYNAKKNILVLLNFGGFTYDHFMSHAHSSGDEEKMVTRKQKAEGKTHEDEHSPKKSKPKNDDGHFNGKSTGDSAAEFDNFCKAVTEHLSVAQMLQILEINGQDSSGSDDDVVARWIVTLLIPFYWDCSEWSTCSFNTTDPPRVEELIKLPESVQKSPVSDRDSGSTYKPFVGMVIALSGRLSQTHQYWKSKIEKHGGKVSNSVSGATCLVVSTTERERGGSSKVAEAVERGVPVVSEAWLIDSIEKQEPHICVMQLITVPNTGLHLYYTKGRASDDTKAEERLEERENVDGAVKEFAKLFEELTGNEFEPWEREKKFQKKPQKFYPVDMGDGGDVRHGGLGLRQKGVAVAHCKLDPFVANFMKVLCSQEIYRYALVEMGLDSPDLPMAMLSDVHLKRCEAILLQYVETVKTLKETRQKPRAVWLDFSMKWFTLLHSTRPFIFHDYNDLAHHSYGVSVDKIFAAELSACPSYDEIKKMPNKALLWRGTQSSNLLRHLHKGLLPSICSLPVQGYMLGRAIICSDAAAEATTYGFTAVDRPDGFLVLAIASLGEQITEYNRTPEAEVSIRFLVAVKYEEQGVKKGRNPGSEKT